MLQELVNMGVTNIITFDAHDARIQNAIPLSGFDDVRPTYQMIKSLIRTIPDVSLDKEDTVIISPDEGAMSRCMYYSSVLGLDIGMFYKRRNYSIVVNGRNPIEAHEYLGRDLHGKDVIIVDDMISSGESLLDVALQLKEKGAKRIFAFASFGLYTDGLDKFDKAYAEGIITRVFNTNLVYRRPDLYEREWFVEVNMCKYVSYIIDTLNHDDTISELLNPIKRIHNLMDKHKKEQTSQIKMQFED
jgi:ribose-phosphate pyrophosphokinase